MQIFQSCTSDLLPKKIYQLDQVFLKWTAYKYIEKFGVSGTFDQVEISGAVDSENLLEVIEKIELIIHTQSINSDLSLRDQNILNFFFSQTSNLNFITGKVMSVEGDEHEGILLVLLDFNEIQKVLDFDYSIIGEEIHLQANWNAEEWNVLLAIDNMRTCCEKFHTGEDGVHMVWPDVKIEIIANLDILYQ